MEIKPAPYLGTCDALVGAARLDVRANKVTLGLFFRVTGVLFYIPIEVLSSPPAAHLMSRGGKVLVAAGHRGALCVKRLGGPVLFAVDAHWQARVPVALQVGVEGSLNEPPQLGAGVRVPGVREERRDVEVAAGLRCRSGAFL